MVEKRFETPDEGTFEKEKFEVIKIGGTAA